MYKFIAMFSVVITTFLIALFVWGISSAMQQETIFEEKCINKGGKPLYIKNTGHICVKNEYFIEVK